MPTGTVAPPEVRSSLAVALDVDDSVAALRLARELQPWFGVAKVGLELYSASGPDVVGALRIADQLAVAWLPPAVDADSINEARVLRHDRASGLFLLQLEEPHASVARLATASALRAGQPRYLIATEPTAQSMAFRPVFVAALDSRA